MKKGRFFLLAFLQIAVIAFCIKLLYFSECIGSDDKDKLNRLLGKFILINGGDYRIGLSDEANCPGYSQQDTIDCKVSRFQMQDAEVTRALFSEVMGIGWQIEDEKTPMANVSWDEVQIFIKKLNELTKEKFRLPTEIEWEYAARGGESSIDYCYSGSHDINEVGWCKTNSQGVVHPIRQKKPNQLGIYDMSGNVSEWCENFHSDQNLNGCQLPSSGSRRSIRGGSYILADFMSAVATRYGRNPDEKHESIGFRLIREEN